MKTCILLLVMSLSLCSCIVMRTRTNGRIKAPVRKSPAAIEQFLSTQTPLGSSSSNTAAFINEKLQHDEGWAPMFSEHDKTCQKGTNCPEYGKGLGFVGAATVLATGATAPADWVPDNYYKIMPDLKPILAKSWKGNAARMRVVLGKYWGIPFRVWVIGEWTFDRSDRLINISVRKETDAL